MKSAVNYEAPGADAAEECLNTILNAKNQGEAVTALGDLLDNLSGSGEIAKGARRGASVMLIPVVERGLAAIRADRVRKARNTKKAGRHSANELLATVLDAGGRDALPFAIVTFLWDIAGDGDTNNAKHHGAAEILSPIIERGLVSLFGELAT